MKNIKLLRRCFGEKLFVLGFPFVQLIGGKRCSDSSACFHSSVPALTREVNEEGILLMVNKVKKLIVSACR